MNVQFTDQTVVVNKICCERQS